MPEERQPAQLPHVDLDSEPLKTGKQSFEDDYALSLVNQDFNDYESYRTQNHDPRWNTADSLYCSYVPPKVWEGTRIPKAALSNPVTFSHIETVLPILEQAIFGTDTDWFQTSPEPGGDPQEAKAIKNHLLYLLEHDHDDYGRTARREIAMSIKSLLTYGNGAIKVYYDPERKRPCVEWVDIRDLYIDPGTTTPSVDDARSLIQRIHYTVDELDAMRDTPGMNIPPREVLSYFASQYRSAVADRTKTVQESYRGVNYTPGSSDYAALPSDRKVEVLIRYSASKIIWVLGREWVAYNGTNPYGFIPFCIAPCYTFLGRFYALSFPDVLGDAQQYISGLYNARLNGLALSLNPPRIKRAGSTMTPAQERWAPGTVINTNNPKEDFVFPTMNSQTENIMGDIEYMLQSTEKITGANGVMGGVPRGGNVNRTATGVSSQSQGGSSRLYYIVKNIEDYLIVPMLYKLYKLVQFHTDVNTLLPALGEDDKQIQIGAAAFKQPMRFQMIAATRMLTKDKLMSIMPFLSQYYLNGSFIQQLHGTGKTVDFDEFQRLIQDASGTGRMYKLVRPMSQQEQQALSQPPPQTVAEQQMAQAKFQNEQQLEDKKNQTAVQVAQIANAPDPTEQARASQQLQIDAAKADQENKNNLLQMTMDQQRKAAETRQSLQADALKTHLEVGAKAQELSMQAREHQMTLSQTHQEHVQKMEHTEKENDQKLKLARLMAALKAQESMKAPAAPAGDE